MGAVKFYLGTHLHIEGVVGARVGHGVGTLPRVLVFAHSLALLWKPGEDYIRMFEQGPNVKGQFEPSHVNVEYPDWRQLRFVQFLMTSEPVTVVDQRDKPDDRTEEAPSPRSSQSNRLSTVVEGSNETSDDQLNQTHRL